LILRIKSKRGSEFKIKFTISGKVKIPAQIKKTLPENFFLISKNSPIKNGPQISWGRFPLSRF
jgi:hypothetical protein